MAKKTPKKQTKSRLDDGKIHFAAVCPFAGGKKMRVYVDGELVGTYDNTNEREIVLTADMFGM